MDRRAWVFGCIAIAAALPGARSQARRPVLGVLSPASREFAPSVFVTLVNRKVARTLNIALPAALLLRADEVVE